MSDTDHPGHPARAGSARPSAPGRRREGPPPGRLATWWRLATAASEPTPEGLPRARALLTFPALLLLALAVLVGLGITGSSSGAWWRQIGGPGADPRLLLGEPRLIRSDEWRVQSSWFVSQYSQGFPRINQVFPGGTDASVMNDLPVWDWSALFRPHTLGPLVLDLDQGAAWRWWVPAALMMLAVHFFVVTVLPRRPWLGAVLAFVVVLQPSVQWLWLPIVPGPVTFAFTSMAALVWASRSPSRWGRWVPAALAGYAATSMALSIYVPFMVPALWALIAFVVGHCLWSWRTEGRPLREVLTALVPLVTAGVAAAVVLVAWVWTRREAVEALLSTVYPGQRSLPPGFSTSADLVGWLSAPFQRSLLDGVSEGLGPQQTDAAAPLLVGVFLTVPLIAVLFLQRRRGEPVDWMVVSVVGVQALVFVWAFVPGWDLLAEVMLLDRSLPSRMRLVLLIQIVVAVVVLTHRLDRLRAPLSWYAGAGAAALSVAAAGWAWWRLAVLGSEVVPSASGVVIAAALAAALVALARHRPTAGAAVLLACSAALGAGVNPVYRGVLDLRKDSQIGLAVAKLDAKHPDARWVGIGEVSAATLVESGVRAYNGVQTYPSPRMWEQIDPAGAYTEASNRLAYLTWEPGSGEPTPHVLGAWAPDDLRLTFDSCSRFAQTYVTFVAVDGGFAQDCLQPVRRVRDGRQSYSLYRVVPPGG